ncbi:bifunctional hydroxymethylpyrimidine kinase/phosphomethylpyrimidine kinase [Sulfoacidibacillus thermotolerans]|uniref:Hydroxymethylpyrimidine/phosphomethylpyrimidine kinase n=1 Tax=Sulfoacidibacillus thermotolerans TaxID=1765684 RepID=A0A2U3D833_SULT2|nr:bifunctional hydroxymethylpyrimidine kinase/phosphomethylpyrimidine kinase [Sulfoacidibacillus thermotolerans]PWI57438.1 bifunctional hydroxymethylpyrimidine kinase/phosphomethylpyrimidine kinase [Sulfoacidibacillus thermotolerans]
MTIAGSDSGGGAGIQADLKTFQMLGVFGVSALTAVTAQNTLGVQGIYNLPPDFVRQQIDSIVTDIGVDAVKTGMLSQPEIIETVVMAVKHYRIEKLIVDPVMIAKGGARLLAPNAESALREQLLPIAYVVTPNIPEAEVLTGRRILSIEEMREAAKRICDLGAQRVVIKGGHMPGPESIDVIYDGIEFEELHSVRVETKNTHGTGCTFSSALTAWLARGQDFFAAVHSAKQFISAAIAGAIPLGEGHGPTNHWAYMEQKISDSATFFGHVRP